MKKTVYFLPAIIFALLLGLIIFGTRISGPPIWYAWIILFLISGGLLFKGKFYGGFVGMLPGIQFIYMSTQDTGQALPVERPFGIIIIIFYLLCSCFVFYSKKWIRKNDN